MIGGAWSLKRCDIDRLTPGQRRKNWGRQVILAGDTHPIDHCFAHDRNHGDKSEQSMGVALTGDVANENRSSSRRSTSDV